MFKQMFNGKYIYHKIYYEFFSSQNNLFTILIYPPLTSAKKLLLSPPQCTTVKPCAGLFS